MKKCIWRRKNSLLFIFITDRKLPEIIYDKHNYIITRNGVTYNETCIAYNVHETTKA